MAIEKVYTPKEGEDVHWFLMDGFGHVVTKFHNNGIPTQITVDWMKARFGDPSKEGKEPFTQYRFGLDPLKGVLPGAINVASQDPKSGVGMPTNQMAAFVQAYDIAATLCENGEKSEFVQKYKVTGEVGGFGARLGDSTDPNNRTERKFNGPYGPYEKVAMDGKTYYYMNTRLNRPGDPWYLSPTESKGNLVVSGTMGQGSGTGVGSANMSTAEIKTHIQLIVANYSRDLPPEGEGGRYVKKFRELLKELNSLAR